MCGSSGSGLTVTSISLTYFQAESGLIRALSCSFVPIGTAWSTGSSLFERLLIREAGASLYRATSYSRRPGVSSTTPETRAPWGLHRDTFSNLILELKRYLHTKKRIQVDELHFGFAFEAIFFLLILFWNVLFL